MLRWFWLVVLSMLVSPAWAGDESPPSDDGIFARMDQKFGEYFVQPLASVLFFDVVFWDGDLAVGELPPHKEGEPVILELGDDSPFDGWEIIDSSTSGYTVAERMTVAVDDLDIVLGEPVARVQGSVAVRYRSDDTGPVVAEVRGGPLPMEPCVDAASCGVPLADFADQKTVGASTVLSGDFGVVRFDSDSEQMRVLTDRAPFPVVVEVDEVGDLRLVNQQVPFDRSAFPIAAGATVRSEAGEATVLSVVDGEATIRSSSSSQFAGPIANPSDVNIPLVVGWLVLGAIFFTLRMGFINIRGFGHALMVTAGRYDKPEDEGEISHFQALSSALSATVGLGNIAGVAIAVALGGPGAIPWMILAGFLGMSSKFTECTLGQMYRTVDANGNISGGPFRYLHAGLEEKGLGGLGRVLSVVFAVMCIGGSLGGGNMFQSNQSYEIVSSTVQGMFPGVGDFSAAYGLAIAAMVGVVILGGIRRIGAAAGFIVPVMCGVYVAAALYIIMVNAAAIPDAFAVMWNGAFSTEAGLGGLIGALIQGFKRAAFSNEAGVGSASIAHSAAATEEPVREGIVALLEPFIDTIVVCTMTGLVVVITGAYQMEGITGVTMTNEAFGSVLSWFPYVLTFAVVMFAFSTMISWSYYGERCATFLFGPEASIPYKMLFVGCSFLGAVLNLGNVLDFSDLMILGMAFPNILGLLILSGTVRTRLDDYWGRLKSGAMLADEAPPPLG